MRGSTDFGARGGEATARRLLASADEALACRSDSDHMRRRGARSFVDDLVLSRGVVRSRAVYCCDLLRLSPLTRRFVRFRRTDLRTQSSFGDAAGRHAATRRRRRRRRQSPTRSHPQHEGCGETEGERDGERARAKSVRAGHPQRLLLRAGSWRNRKVRTSVHPQQALRVAAVLISDLLRPAA